MIPLRDNIPSRTTPLVTYVIIAACSIAFGLQYLNQKEGHDLVLDYGMVPARVTSDDPNPIVRLPMQVQSVTGPVIQLQDVQLPTATVTPWLTLLTCMFLHGGVMHFLGNMWFLYIFGDNVEDRLGHIGFALMYLGTGVIASMAHIMNDPASGIPTIGASGAIAGVMGAYAWLYPKAKVQAILPIPFFFRAFVIPAPVFLGIWFAMQTYSGIQSSPVGGGVAWWAHIGGFIAGAILALLIGRSENHSTAQVRF